jgi:diguanylate cyclase (GGDEF)-like protein
LDWEELAGIVAETLGLPLLPLEGKREEKEMKRISPPTPVGMWSKPVGGDEGELSSLPFVSSSPSPPQPRLTAYDRTAPAPPQSLHSAVGELWEKFKDKILARVEVLDQAATALVAGVLNDELRESVLKESHKLAGSLGTFGFSEGSNLAREIEQLFQPGGVLAKGKNLTCNISSARRFSELVAGLHQELQETPTPEAPCFYKSNQLPQLLANQQPRLLIVEDDIELAQRLVMEAVAWGMNADRVNSISAAREAIQKTRPDLVLLDLSFPDTTEDGLTLLRELSHQSLLVPVIVLTFRNTFIDRVEVARLGGCAFLQKPVSAGQVMEVVSQVLQQGHTNQFKVMLVDDDPRILSSLQSLLQRWGIQIHTLDDPQQLWDALESTAPDLLVLDVEMPQVSGIELCQVIRNDPKWSSLPVLFLSTQTDAETVQRMFSVGADDYVSKPIADSELVTRIFNRLERIRLLRSIAETDVLTGVANRRKSTQDLERFLRLANRQGQPLCFAVLDLDHFKQINDQYGHGTGDKVLQRLGKLLLQSFRSEDVVARWGGEEFVLGLYGVNKPAAVKRLLQALETLRQQEFIEQDGRTFRVTFSAGVVQYPEEGADLQSLYHKADQLLYQAKAAGRDRVLSAD